MSYFKEYEPRGALKSAHLSKVMQTPEIVDKLSDWVKKPKGILYAFGNVGTGKSYVAAAIYNLWKEHKKTVRFYSEDNLFEELKICMHIPEWPPDYRVDTIAQADHFVLDDFGSTLSLDKEKSEWKKEMLFKLLDIRYSLNTPTIITSNLNKSELRSIFHERFVSRLYSVKNTILDISGPDRRQIPQFENDD